MAVKSKRVKGKTARRRIAKSPKFEMSSELTRDFNLPQYAKPNRSSYERPNPSSRQIIAYSLNQDLDRTPADS